MADREKLLINELRMLQKREQILLKIIEKSQNTLNKLQVEELTIRNHLSRIQDVELKSRNVTPLESEQAANSPLHNSEENLGGDTNALGHDITMNELQINQSTLNLDAAPLIQRMLEDSQVYEEEEEDEDEADKDASSQGP